MTKKEHAIAAIQDLASDYFYYDRKEDEDLTRDDLVELAMSNSLTIEEALEAFGAALRENWPCTVRDTK
jgi:hypothetical protein